MWFILVIILLSLVYYLGQKNYGHWKKRGVPGPKPVWFVGNVGNLLIGRKSMGENYGDIYREFEGHAIVGIYRVGTPVLLIRDLDFFKVMMVKDFKNFHDNDLYVDKEVDRVVGRNPFFLKGTEWKHKRAALTSCFTSGKIKGMFPILKKVTEEMVKYVEENSSGALEAREVCIRFTLNNVAACAFGLEGKCFEEKNPEFRKLADEFLSPSAWVSFVIVLFTMFPALSQVLKVPFVSKRVEEKLINLVGSTLNYRRKNNIIRNDFLEYVTELTKTSDLFKEEIDIVAQAATFFADGYETSSRVMSFVIFELARNPDVQEKLRKEINTVCGKYENQVTYEGIQEMTYLDACFYESMRITPIIGQLFKLCTEKYTYTPTDPKYKKNTVVIDEGTSIILPIGAIQKDPKYFDNPDKYIPERFLDKDKIVKFSFIPFGEGPRQCLGMRFGVTQIKLGLAQLVRNFKITVNSKTKLPLQFDKFYLMPVPIGGLWVNFEKI